MNGIGLMLRGAREENGVSLEEASEDLKIKPAILYNIEEGNMGCFKDIFILKDYLKDYAKYLGIDPLGKGELMHQQHKDNQQVDQINGADKTKQIRGPVQQARENADEEQKRRKEDPEDGILNLHFGMAHPLEDKDKSAETA